MNTTATLMLIGLAMLATAGIIGLAALGQERPPELGEITKYIVAGVFGGGATAVAGAGVNEVLRRRELSTWTRDATAPPESPADGLD